MPRVCQNSVSQLSAARLEPNVSSHGFKPPGGMTEAKFDRLCLLGQDPLLDYRVTLNRIYQETNDHLDVLAREVREGKNVLEASFFLRWLEFSGVLSLLEKHALPGQDFTSLRRKLSDLIGEYGEHFRGGRVAPKYAESDITEINRKLDILLADKARSVSTVTVVTMVKQVPSNSEALDRQNGTDRTCHIAW